MGDHNIKKLMVETHKRIKNTVSGVINLYEDRTNCERSSCLITARNLWAAFFSEHPCWDQVSPHFSHGDCATKINTESSDRFGGNDRKYVRSVGGSSSMTLNEIIDEFGTED